MTRLATLSVLVALVLTGCAVSTAPDWGRFRGPNGSGVAVDDRVSLPSEIDPKRNLIWKTALPPGHSSPVLDGVHVYVTAVERARLLTIALSRVTGHEVWRREAPIGELEEVHQIGSRAQPSPATDGERVVVFFGSSGLLCYDRDGERLWHRPMGPFKNNYGAASSPLIHGSRVIVQQDHDEGSFVAAFDLETGDAIWRADRTEFPRGFSSPVVWDSAGRTQIVVVGTLRVVGYDIATGEEVWTVHGLGRIASMSPVVAPDGQLVVAVWAPGGDATDRIEAALFDDVLAANDADGNGILEKAEAPRDDPVAMRFDQIDRDKDGGVTRHEYDDMRRIFAHSHNAAISIRPGGAGDISATHVTWRTTKGLPYVPSLLVYRGCVYLIKNGGILTTLDAATGEVHEIGRVTDRGQYYASPVAGDGKVYVVSRNGTVSIVRAAQAWEELAATKLGETTFATPAIADGKVYVRTDAHLYCFGER